MTSTFPNYQDHQQAWEELAQGIAALKNRVRNQDLSNITPGSKKGELIIIGTGIESIGISVGDQKQLEQADKVLYCIADPATIIWLKKLRPDALDLYVLYGENKIRYTTYMQMSEAQLYWVRQGLKVVVAFYGHPGIFVLSTHRAIKIARREGYTATMKAGVCALDTLCADLGIDPCHPGLQTHEATDALVRRRQLDPSLHVILWQVGLIGELGYRRHGYLNNKFSYFIRWLQSIYGDDYGVAHYIGSRYPGIEPTVETYALSELHDPEKQIRITGLSTFYIPPRDPIPTHRQTAIDLGLIEPDQHLLTPQSPLREIDLYGPREMQAFKAFEQFRIPPSYKWQAETEAGKFLIALRFDTALQDLYRSNPLAALDQSGFNLSDRERALLASRDSGAIQIAAKGAYQRCGASEACITRLLTERGSASAVLRIIANQNKAEARRGLGAWLQSKQMRLEWEHVFSALDYIQRNHLYPWSGIYLEPEQKILITIIGNQRDRSKSIIYLNQQRIRKFHFENACIKWAAHDGVTCSGFLRLDIDNHARRRLLGKITDGKLNASDKVNFSAREADPARTEQSAVAQSLYNGSDLSRICGQYILRTNGSFSRELNLLQISEAGLKLNDQEITDFSFRDGVLSWQGGNKGCHNGQLRPVLDPFMRGIEWFGQSATLEGTRLKCYGASLTDTGTACHAPGLPDWAREAIGAIVLANRRKGGLMLWHKWEKSNFAAMVLNRYLLDLV